MNITEARAAGKKVLALIDGKSVFYRGYYAMPNLATRDGRPTGGVYGFAALAIELINRIKPDYVAIAWDKRGTNIRRRKAIYAGYKANRQKAPDDFYEQIPILMDLLDAFGWPLYEVDDYEADDIMGTLSQKAGQQNIHSILISSDLDLLQLIDDDTEVYALKKGLSNLEKFDPVSFTDKYGIRVDQFLDLKSLKGDSSDNIPGVAGIGEKTAATLLQKFDNLDNIYDHLDQIAGKTKDKLSAGKDSAYMSRELARIWCDAPIPLDLTATDINNLDKVKLHQALTDLQFSSLLRRLPENFRVESTDQLAVQVNSNWPTFVMKKVTEIKLSNDQPLVAATINEGVLVGQNSVGCLIPFASVGDILANKKIIVHDAKLLANQLLAHALPLDFTVEFDTKHAGFLLDSLQPSISLSEYLAENGKEVPSPVDYLAATYNLYADLSAKLTANEQLNHLAQTVDFPLQLVLARMENYGVQVDTEQLEAMSNELAGDILAIEQEIWQLAGVEFNIASPKQLSDILFEKLGLPPTAKKNKSGNYPTGAKELAKLSHVHPIIDQISKYRELSKLKSTYVDALPKSVASDGRIHTTLDQDVTATGRLSSSNPNLQNIPTRTERGRKIKRAFVATPGRVIINADYAQFELRLAAALAQDKDLITMFSNDDYDIHTLTAAQAYGVDADQVTAEQRRHAKVINFGVLYGMSPHGLADATDMTFAEAKAFIDRYFAVRHKIRTYIDKVLRQADEQGYVETLFGRRRPTPDVKSSNFMVREAAKRAAANMPIQGTEADLMKMAMLKIQQISGAYQFMQIHDSIMVECEPSDVDRISSEMRHIMENVYPDLGVRLVVDIKIGKSWLDVA